ncbi:hypothetical protein Tco_0620148 [Tanacetum coccineum]
MKVGEKYKIVAQVKKYLTYYALANGFSLWHERSGEERVVAKYGQRLPKMSAPEKADLVMKKYKCKVSLNQCVNARKYALTEYEKNIGEHPNQGEILTAIGRDGNNHIYPVAWAVVNVENKDNWTRFLELLEEDLGCSRGNGLTLMSDQHKVASKASYPQLFNKITDKIKSANPNAHKNLMDKNPKTWSRAFFELDRGCEAIENCFSEMNKMREISRKWNPRVCPNIKKRLEWLKEQQRLWHVIPAGRNLFEVRSGSEGFTVDEALFETDMYFVAYHNYVKPVPGMNFWPNQSMYSTVLPPKPRKMPGRPKKKIIRVIGEGDSSTRVSKVGSQGIFSNCKQPGHNKSSCKEHVVEQTPKPKRGPGRPRKKQLVDDLEDVDAHRGPVRDEGASGTRRGVSRTRGGAIGSKGRRGRGGRGVGGSGSASGLIGRGDGGFGGASVSRGRGVGESRGRGAGGSKRKLVSTSGT